MQIILDNCFKFVQTVLAEISVYKLGEFIFSIVMHIVKPLTAMIANMIMCNAHYSTS